MDKDLLSAYKYDFPQWVSEQKMQSSVFSCDSDIRIDHPFPDDDSMTALWASHDCSDYDLFLTVLMDDEAELNLVGYTGADLSDKGCKLADYWGEDIYACEYSLPANGEPLGILFKGGFRPLFYTTYWTQVESWQPAFDWW